MVDDLNKCLKQIKLPISLHRCTPISQLLFSISTIGSGSGVQTGSETLKHRMIGFRSICLLACCHFAIQLFALEGVGPQENG